MQWSIALVKLHVAGLLPGEAHCLVNWQLMRQELHKFEARIFRW